MLSSSSLLAILAAHGVGWCERQFDNGRKCSWIKVLEYGSTVETKHAYGLLRTGDWVAEFADELRVMPVGYYVPFFPLLEMTHQCAVDSLKRSVERVSLPAVVYTTFPFDDILEAACRDLGYWSQLAGKWIDSGYPINGVIADAIPGNRTVQKWNRERFNRIYFADSAETETG